MTSTFGSLSFNKKGDLCFEAYFTSERELVTWIDAQGVNELLITLNINAEEALDEAHRGAILDTLNSKFGDLQEFTSWLDKHGISSETWGWP